MTDNQPKAQVKLNGRALLDWQLDACHAAGIDDIVIVGGYLAEQLRRPGTYLLINENFACTNMVQSTLEELQH